MMLNNKQIQKSGLSYKCMINNQWLTELIKIEELKSPNRKKVSNQRINLTQYR